MSGWGESGQTSASSPGLIPTTVLYRHQAPTRYQLFRKLPTSP